MPSKVDRRSRHPFVLVDVFATSPLAGNPLAVFPEAGALNETTMQAIAREFGHSETTFVLPARDPAATWRLRCFTPTEEVFGAGHNALGAWWVLASTGRVGPSESEPATVVRQELGGSVLPVEILRRDHQVAGVFMTQGTPTFGDSMSDFGELARALGVPEADLGVAGLRPQAVSTGAMHLLVPLSRLDLLRRVRIDAERLVRLARPLGCQGAYLFTLETLDAASCAHARAFFPGIGIAEDPATGSAAGPLAALLASRGHLRQALTSVVEQGDEMGRPSRIECKSVGIEFGSVAPA